MDASRGLIAPSAPLVLRAGRDGRVELADPASGQVLAAEGVLARELVRLADGEDPSPALRALAELQPAVAALLIAERLPLEPRAALALDGFDLLFLELTGQCNERCLHCYAESAPEVTTALAIETCRQVIDDAVGLGFRAVQLTGGDPLLCPFLVELVRHAHGRLAVELYTNGLALKEDLCEQLAPLRPAFAFSFYSHDEAVHDRITRTPGSQRRTLTAIERARRHGFAVRVSVVVMPENQDGGPATLDFLAALGIDDLGVAGSHGVGRGGYFAGALPLRGSSHRGGESIGRSGTLCVLPGGEVVPCIFNRTDVLGRVPQQRLHDIVARPLLPAPETAERALWRCHERLSCVECRTTAVALRAIAEGP